MSLVIEGPCVFADGTRPKKITIDQDKALIESISDCDGQADYIFGVQHRIFPGFIDMHVHCREDPKGTQNYKEDFESACKAALNGGVTTIADMPNNPWPPTNRERYDEKCVLVEDRPINVLLYGGIGPRTECFGSDLPYKAYMGPSIGDLFFEEDRTVFRNLSSFENCFVAVHAESCHHLKSHEEENTHEKRRPPVAEIDAIKGLVEFLKEGKLHLHVAHLSTAEGLRLVRMAKEAGASITCEVTPHHLYFHEGNMDQGRYLQMNPPLRKEEDCQALLEGLKDGSIDALATDHAPHSLEENQKGISGVPHLDTYGLFVTWLMVEHGFSDQDILRVCCQGPAKLLAPFHDHSLGKLEVGSQASIVVMNTQQSTDVDQWPVFSKAGYAPFAKMHFPGCPVLRVAKGQTWEPA